MTYTTQVHSYTVKIPRPPLVGGFHTSCILSINKLDMGAYVKLYSNECEISYNGLIDATEITQYNSPTQIRLEGYKRIHTNTDSRGSYISHTYVPNDWDENHPIVQHTKKIAQGQQTRQDQYYSQKWV